MSPRRYRRPRYQFSGGPPALCRCRRHSRVGPPGVPPLSPLNSPWYPPTVSPGVPLFTFEILFPTFMEFRRTLSAKRLGHVHSRLKRTGGAKPEKISRNSCERIVRSPPPAFPEITCYFFQFRKRTTGFSSRELPGRLGVTDSGAARAFPVKNSRHKRQSTLHVAKFRSNRAVISSA